MDYLFFFVGIAVYLGWRKRLRNKDKPKLSSSISRIAGFVFGASIAAVGVAWFLDFSGLLSSVGSGVSREHFAGVMGIILGPIFSIFGIFVAIASLAAPIHALENWVAKEHEDIKLW